MRITRLDAIKSLCPTVDLTVVGNSTITFWSDDSVAKPTDSAIDAELTRLNNAESMRLLRLERDSKLVKTDWMSLSDSPTMSDAWKTYRQALRDLPASASPKLESDGNLDMTSVTFPTEPS